MTVQVNADLKVGAVAETITVTGETPVVDVQSATQMRTVTAQAFKELPSGGSWIQMAALVPAVRASNVDVGGVLGDQTGAEVSAHGSRNGDGVSMIDGMRIGNMYLSSNLTNMSLSPLLFDEVNVQFAGQLAETGTNGVIMNAIPRSGGNRFSRDVPRERIQPESSELEHHRQPAVAGCRERVGDAEEALRPQRRLRRPHQERQTVVLRDVALFHQRVLSGGALLCGRSLHRRCTRTTPSRQAYARHVYLRQQRAVDLGDLRQAEALEHGTRISTKWIRTGCSRSSTPRRRPRAITTWHTQLSTTKWTYTATNKLLFEVGVVAGASPDTILLDPAQVGTCSSQGALAPRCIGIVEQAVR